MVPFCFPQLEGPKLQPLFTKSDSENSISFMNPNTYALDLNMAPAGKLTIIDSLEIRLIR